MKGKYSTTIYKKAKTKDVNKINQKLFYNQISIIVNNNERISLGTIKTYGKIEIGKDYSEDDLNQVLKKLYLLYNFDALSMAF